MYPSSDSIFNLKPQKNVFYVPNRPFSKIKTKMENKIVLIFNIFLTINQLKELSNF